MKKDALMDQLASFELSNERMSNLRGGDRPTLVSEEFWDDGLNTYRDSYWSDGSQVCSQFWGCDCGNVAGGGAGGGAAAGVAVRG